VERATDRFFAEIAGERRWAVPLQFWPGSRSRLIELVHARRSDHARALGSYLVFFCDQMTDPRPKVRFRGTPIKVNWSAAYAWPQSLQQRREIEAIFLVANVAWYSLELIDNSVSRLAADVLLAEARNHKRARMAERSRVLRLAYLEAVDALRPIRWTHSQDHLDVLSELHETWRTDRIWDTVEDRTTWLAAHYEQLQADRTERRNSEFAILGFVIALFSVTALASVFADVFTLYHIGFDEQSMSTWANHAGDLLGYAIVPPLGVIAAILGYGGLRWVWSLFK
jgi:hypothetical protein